MSSMLNVILMLSVTNKPLMQSVIMKNVVMLSVVIPSVVMLSVGAPSGQYQKYINKNNEIIGKILNC